MNSKQSRIIIAIVVGVFVVGGIIAWLLFTVILRGNPQENPYSQQLTTVEQAQKSFNVGEVAEVGPYDVTVKQSELEGTEKKVTLLVVQNQSRATQYNKLAYSLDDWLGSFERVELSGVAPSSYSAENALDSEFERQANTSEGIELEYVFNMNEQPSSYQLEYTIIIFTRTSSLVGTEGMPSKEFTYTLNLQ